MQHHAHDPSSNTLIHELSSVVVHAANLDELVRPLLTILKTITGIETTFFTQIDLDKNIQTVIYSYNSATLQVPEGFSIDWGATLCQRALAEQKFATNEVDICWADNAAAQQLNIRTYVSEPVFIGEHQLYGTLCAISTEKKPLDELPRDIIKLFSTVIARQIERDRLIQLLQLQNMDWARLSRLDPLTGLHNRRGIEKELDHMLNTAHRLGLNVQLAFIDLDDFKAINDTYGHRMGDAFLRQMAQHLQNELRETDLVARYGGDEFLVAMIAQADQGDRHASAWRERLAQITHQRFDINGILLDYAGASVGVAISSPGELDANALIARADAAMYQQKIARKTSH